MLRKSLVLAIALFVFVLVDARAQDAGSRSQTLAASLDKTKYKKKDKPTVKLEIYIDIKNEPVVRDAASLAGSYESEDNEYALDLQVSGGSVSGSGWDRTPDGNRRRSFTLKDARLEGALLTATKVYDGGEQEKFESVFVNRTVTTGRNVNDIDSRDTKFGLGFIQDGSRAGSDKGEQNWTSRVFLMRR